MQVVKLKYIGLIAAAIGATAILPLIIRVTRYKTTRSLSYVWLCLDLIASILWLWYGIVNKLTAVSVGALFSIGSDLYLICFKAVSERIHGKKCGTDDKDIPIVSKEI